LSPKRLATHEIFAAKTDQQLAEDGRPLCVAGTLEFPAKGVFSVMLSTTDAA